MEAYIWLILASMLAVGVLVGYFMGRSKGDTSLPKVQELEQSIAQANQEMQDYRGQVTGHFEKTANLFNQLTNDYREVYEHLANSSEQLCGDQVAKLKGLTAETKVLEGEGKKVESQASEAVSEKKPDAEEVKPEPEVASEQAKAESEAAPEPETAPEPEATNEETSAEPEKSLEAESKTESDVPPGVAKIDEKADEARTIH